MSEPSAWSLVEAAAVIRIKQVSSRELTEVCLGRIAAHDPQLKAFIRIDGDAALTAAEKADAELAAGTIRGPLHGVPLAHKDQFERDGQISTSSPARKRS